MKSLSYWIVTTATLSLVVGCEQESTMPEASQQPAVEPQSETMEAAAPAASMPVQEATSFGGKPLYRNPVDAAKLVLTQDVSIYRAQLDTFIGRHGSIVNRLSARLRQLLLAQQRSSWSFDQEEGMLDTSRLYRVVTSPANPLTLKVEVDSLFKDTTVSLLIDNSIRQGAGLQR